MIPTILIASLIALVTILIIVKEVKRRKLTGGCSCNCGSCDKCK